MTKEEIQIKIKICDRIYPMRIASDDEYILRQSSKEINDAVVKYMNKFTITDNQDLLAMVAFDSVVSRLQNNKVNIELIVEKIDKILDDIGEE